MKARLLNSVLLACAVCVAPAGFAQTPKPAPNYSAPKTSFGHPDLEGVWTSNFMTMLEGAPDVPLVLPEKEAKEYVDRAVDAFAERTTKGLDPELPEIAKATEGLPSGRGDPRTRTVVQPANGVLP